MDSLTDLLTEHGLSIVSDLRDQMDKYNRNASGRTKDEINFEVSSGEVTNLTVFAPKHIVALQDGRGPTGSGTASSPPLIERIKQWISDKGIQSDIPIDSLAFLITRKIHREGYQGSPGLIDEVINDTLIDKISTGVLEIVGKTFFEVLDLKEK